MSQYKFLDRRFQEYNLALMKTLQNLATLLEMEKRYPQGNIIRIMLLLLWEVEIKNAKSIAAIEEDIEKSLLLD